MLQLCQLILVEPIQCLRFRHNRKTTQLDDALQPSVPAKSQETCVPTLSRFTSALIFLPRAPRCEQPVSTASRVAHCLPLFLFLFMEMLNSATVPRVSIKFAPFSTNITNSDNCLFPSVLQIRRRLDSSIQSCNFAMLLYCSTEAETGFVQTSAHFFRFGNFLDSEISALYSFLHPKKSGVNVFHSGFCSQPIRQRFCRRADTLDFNFHLNSQAHVFRSQGRSNLTSFHHREELHFSHAQRCSRSEVWIQIPLCVPQSAPPIPSCSFSRLGRLRNRCPRRL